MLPGTAFPVIHPAQTQGHRIRAHCQDLFFRLKLLLSIDALRMGHFLFAVEIFSAKYIPFFKIDLVGAAEKQLCSVSRAGPGQHSRHLHIHCPGHFRIILAGSCVRYGRTVDQNVRLFSAKKGIHRILLCQCRLLMPQRNEACLPLFSKFSVLIIFHDPGA